MAKKSSGPILLTVPLPRGDVQLVSAASLPKGLAQAVSNHRLSKEDAIVCTLIAVGIVIVFSPILSADFVWDDKIMFHDEGWFRSNPDWSQMLSHGFAEWKNYFRPLGLALFLVEARLFGANPMPFHAVSLALHVANALILSRLARAWFPTREKPLWVPAFAMLFYGMHPTVIEPVSWIAAQCDLLATLLVLAGLFFNVRTESARLRAAIVAACCLLGLMTKESAAALPLLIVLSDWYTRAPRLESFASSVRRLVTSNVATYVLLAAAVLAYTILRHYALGGIGFSVTSPTIVRYVQTIDFLYIRYWQLIVLPFSGLSPMHTAAQVDLDHASVLNAAYVVSSLLLVLAGVMCTVRRHPVGFLLLGVTASLLAVLHLLPVDFDDSLYHERYAIIAVAFFAAFFPVALNGVRVTATGNIVRLGAVAVGIVWLAASVVAARAVIPMWKNDIAFWQWTWRNEPKSIVAMDHLMAAYIDANRLPEALRVSQVLLEQDTTCFTCLLNIAYLALEDGNAQQASAAVERAGVLLTSSQPSRLDLFQYILTIGNLRQLQKQPAEAEMAYRDAIATDELNPDGYFSLALLLAREGRIDDARLELERVRALSSPDEFAKRTAAFEGVVSDAAARRKEEPSD